MIISFIKKHWKNALYIGRDSNLHYLEKQRISILNAILVLVIGASLMMTGIYYLIDFEYKNIGLIVLPVCFISLWCNAIFKHTTAKHIAFFGILTTITIWCYFTRNSGAHFFYITLGCGVASIFSQKKTIFITMFIAALFFKIYIFWNYLTPFTPIANVNYQLLNFMLLYVAAAIIFFQIMVHLDINRKISKLHDRQLQDKNEAIKTLKFTEDKLKESNNQLLAFNNKLDKLVKKSSDELYSFQAAINDNLFSIVTDQSNKILKINDNYLDKIGYTKQEIIGKQITFLQSDQHSQSFYENISKTIYQGKVWRGESKIKTKSGADFWLLSSIMPIKTASGVIKSFLTISSDITDKKVVQKKEQLTQQSLIQSENKLSLILQNLSDLVAITHNNGDRKYVNKSFCEFFGKDAVEFIGTNYRDQKTENISQSYLRLVATLSIENPSITFLDVLLNAANEKKWIIWKEMALFDSDGMITEIFSIGHDVTEIKEIEFQNANFIAQFEEIAFKTSHNFRGPLTSIMGLVSLIEDDSFDETELKQISVYMKGAILNLDAASRELAVFIEKYKTEKIDSYNDTDRFNFEEAKIKHLNWKYKIRNFLDGIGSMTQIEAVSEHHSELGKWYYNEGKSIYGHMVAMQQFEIEQEKMHQIVRQILDLKANEEDIKSELIYQQLGAVSDKILVLLDEAEAEVSNFVLKN